MSDPEESERRAYRRLDEALRELPLRRAPRSLEARVLQALARRPAPQWWLGPYAQWPQGARAVFVAASLLLALLVAYAGSTLMPDWQPLAAHSAHRITLPLWALGEVYGSIAAALPASWVRAILAAATALYVALFALAALAYRLLYLSPLATIFTPKRAVTS